MTRDELVHRANEYSLRHWGFGFSLRTLRLWREQGFIPGPTTVGKGRGQAPQRVWPPLAYRRVLQLQRLKAQGYRRDAARLVDLWLRGHTFPMTVVREQSRREVERHRRLRNRGIPATWDPRVGGAVSARTRQAVVRAMSSEPEAPDDFWGVPPGETAFDLASVLFGAPMAGEAIVAFMARNLAESGMLPEDMLEVSPLALVQELVAAMRGIATDPQESDLGIAATLDAASDADLLDVRDFALVFPWMMGSLSTVLPLVGLHAPAFASFIQATQGRDFDTRLRIFEILLRLAGRESGRTGNWGRFAREVLKPLRRIVAFSVNDSAVLRLLGAFGPPDQPLLALLQWVQAMGQHEGGREGRQLRRLLWRHGLREIIEATRAAT